MSDVAYILTGFFISFAVTKLILVLGQKTCPYCQMSIPRKATRCPKCQSDL